MDHCIWIHIQRSNSLGAIIALLHQQVCAHSLTPHLFSDTHNAQRTRYTLFSAVLLISFVFCRKFEKEKNVNVQKHQINLLDYMNLPMEYFVPQRQAKPKR